MKKAFSLVSIFIALACLTPLLRAQESAAAGAKTPSVTLKIQVTIAEHDGEKKLANLPYSFFLTAGTPGSTSPWTKVRMGSRVPVYVGKEGGMQYIDIGTNIDSRAFAGQDGRFDISLNLERSWVEGDVLLSAEKPVAAAAESSTGQFKEPIIRQFKTELVLSVRDGQTVQTTQATDPLSGRVLTLTLTANVVK